MKKSILTKVLVFVLATSMLLGNVTPAYAAEVIELQNIDVGDENEVYLPVTVAETGISAPELIAVTDENGNIIDYSIRNTIDEEVKITCGLVEVDNPEKKHGNYQLTYSPEEESSMNLSSFLESMMISGQGYLNGEYYIYAYAETVEEENYAKSNETILDSSVIKLSKNDHEEAANVEIVELTDSDTTFWYFNDFYISDYDDLVLWISGTRNGIDSNISSWAYDYDDVFYAEVERAASYFDEWDLECIYLTNYEYNEQGVELKYDVYSKFEVKKDDNNDDFEDFDEPIEEEILIAPTLTYDYDEEQNSAKLVVENNADVDISAIVGLIPNEYSLEEYEEIYGLHYGTVECNIPAGEDYEIDLLEYNEILAECNYETGEYHFFVYAESYDENYELLGSCKALCEDYSVMITSEIEEVTVYYEDDSSYWYFDDYVANNYKKMTLELGYIEDGIEGWNVYHAYVDDINTFYVDTQEYDDAHGEWELFRVILSEIAFEEDCINILTLQSSPADGFNYVNRNQNGSDSNEEGNTELPAPTVEIVRDEDENVCGINITNNYGEERVIWEGFYTEEQLESGNIYADGGRSLSGNSITSSDDIEWYGRCAGDVPESGTYYYACFITEDDDNMGNRSAIAVLEDYPFYISISEDSNTYALEKGSYSGNLYLSGINVSEYQWADYDGVGEYLEEENLYTSTLGGTLEWGNEQFYLSKEWVDQYNDEYSEWSIKEISLENYQAEKDGYYIDIVKLNNFSEGVYEEVAADAPTLNVYTYENDTCIEIKNNDINACDIYCGFVSVDNFEETFFNGSYWLEGEETEELSVRNIAMERNLKPGQYYLAAYAVSKTAVSSEMVVFEDYLFEVNSEEITDTIELDKGEISGNLFVNGINAEDYYYGSANIQYFYSDDEEIYEETSWEYLRSNDGRYYIDSDSLYYYENCFDDWKIESLDLRQYEAIDNKCIITLFKAETFSYGIQEETRVEAPTVNPLRNEDGNIVGVEVTNNSDNGIWLKCRLLRADDGESFSNYSFSLAEEETCEFYFKEFFDWIEYPEGIYHFSCSASDWAGVKADSEVQIFRDYPIIIVKNEVEDTWMYQTGDTFGYQYFKDLPVTDDSFGWMQLSCSSVDGEDSWTSDWQLEDDREAYYFIKDNFNDWYDYWTVSKVVYGIVEPKADGYYVTQNIASSIEESEELYKEPKAPSPTVELCRDEAGNITGVKLISNLSHDLGYVGLNLVGFNGDVGHGIHRLFYKQSVANGESIALFDEMELSTAVLQDALDRFDSIKIVAYAKDNLTGLESEDVLVDCNVTLEIDTYTGNTISVEAEYDDDNNPCYYVNTGDVPEDVFGFEIYGFDGTSNESDRFFKTDDSSKWYVKVWAASGFSISRFVYGQLTTTNSDIKLKMTEVPKTKISVLEKAKNDKNVYLFDYDHYQAFIASGGTVTVEENGLNVSNDRFTTDVLWTIDYLSQKYVGSGIYKFVKSISDIVKESANKYWKSDVGSFRAVDYYDTDGKMIGDESLSKHDIVLIKYEPEIVWVEKINLTAPDTLGFGENAKLNVSLDAGQNKYPFERTPEIRFESSNPDILAVDAKTGNLTAGNKTGTATITVYADEQLRAEEGLDEIVTASVRISVIDPHECSYEYTLEKAATFDADGMIVGTCSCEARDEITVHRVASVQLEQDSYVYDGVDKEPEVIVKDSQGTALVKDTDYTVTYKNNNSAGTAIVTVTLQGNYSGSKDVNFIIARKSIEDGAVRGLSSAIYTGTAITQDVDVVLGTETLSPDDYEVSYSNNINAGTATVIVTGVGNYTGTITGTFEIARKSLEGFEVPEIGTFTYTGKTIEPEVKVFDGKKQLDAGSEYIVQFDNHVNPGKADVTITGIGNYEGTIKTTFVIIGTCLETAAVSTIPNQTYTGTAICPEVTVTLPDSTVLVKDRDYKVTYAKNVNAGTATVTVTGIGHYTGILTAAFEIEARDLDNCKVTVTDEMTYTGKKLIPTVTVKDGSVTLKKDTDYTLSYDDNTNPGKAEVTIKGKGNYAGKLTECFVIVPKKATLSSVTASTTTAGRLTVKWKEDTKADGYMLQYSTSSSFTSSATKTVTIADNDTVSKTLSGLSKGTTYYVRIASYVTVDEEVCRGSYSSKLSAKTKKSFTVNSISDKTYTGSSITPTVTVKSGSTTLKKDTDYTVSYKNNKYTGLATATVKGKGNYAGTVNATFVIKPKKAALKSVTSTGAGKLQVTWSKDSQADGYMLQYSTSSSFTSSTTKNVNVSSNATTSKTISSLKQGKTYYVRVASYVTVDDENCRGTYSDKKSVKVRSSFTVNSISDKTYTGKALVPSVTVKRGSTTLKKDRDYTVSYSYNTNPGLAKVKVVGKGNYAGTVNTTFKIVPKKATLSSVTSGSKGSLTVKWTKDAKATGYLLQYSTSENFTKATTETIQITKYGTVSKTIKNLKSGKKYYVRVAAYKNIDGVVERGAYSAAKTIKIK